MRQFFDILLGVVLAMVLVLVASQGVLTNTEISTAREYHNTVVERLENTGLSDDYVQSIVKYTNENTDYRLTIKPVEGTDEAMSYNVSLKYPIKNVVYSLFGAKTDKYATIDGYASIGKYSPSTTDPDVEKHGKVTNNISLGENVDAKFYEDGYLIISGTGNSITKDSKTIDSIRDYVTNLVFSGNVESIPDNYFSEMTSLEGITFGKIKIIGKNAFSKCGSLKTVLLPKDVTSVQTGAFSNCDSLEYIYINNTSGNININDDVITNCDNYTGTVYLKK